MASKIFWRIFISLIGTALIIIAVADVSLYYFGNTSPATVHTDRFGGSLDSAPSNQYEWSVDYTFYADGKEYSGHQTVRGSAINVKHDNEVHYFKFAPWINSLYAKPLNIGTFVMIGLGVLLIAVMNKSSKKHNESRMTSAAHNKFKKKPPYENDAETDKNRVTLAWLMENTTDYDDRIEEYYQKSWNIGDPSWQCGCGKWNEDNFCSKCGNKKQ